MILYILDIKDVKKQLIFYLLFTVFCILFAIIYQSFSFGVYSNYMSYAFLLPAIFGILVSFILYFFKINKMPSKLESNLYNFGIVTLTIGSIVNGVLEIYGTTNWKVYIYYIIGTFLVISSLICYFRRKNNNN